MVVCNAEMVQKISQYLGVQTPKLNSPENNLIASDDIIKDQTIKGFSTIVQALARDSKHPDLLGRNQLENALVKQWLEYAVLCLNYADFPVNSQRILKELNEALREDNYICRGQGPTVADVTLYYALHSIMVILQVAVGLKNEVTQETIQTDVDQCNLLCHGRCALVCYRRDLPTKRKPSSSMFRDGLTLFSRSTIYAKNWSS